MRRTLAFDEALIPPSFHGRQMIQQRKRHPSAFEREASHPGVDRPQILRQDCFAAITKREVVSPQERLADRLQAQLNPDIPDVEAAPRTRRLRGRDP